MYIVENRGIKNSEAMEFVLLKWSIFWSIIWGKPSINGIKMGKWVRLTNIKYLIAFWTDLRASRGANLVKERFFRDTL